MRQGYSSSPHSRAPRAPPTPKPGGRERPARHGRRASRRAACRSTRPMVAAHAPRQVPRPRGRRLQALRRDARSSPGASPSTARSSPTPRTTSARTRTSRSTAGRSPGPSRACCTRCTSPSASSPPRATPTRRKTVLDLVPAAGLRLYPVGRLDADSSGLILLTNDGELANRLTHPSFEVPKTYRAKLAGPPLTRQDSARAARRRAARGRHHRARASAPRRRAHGRADDPRGPQSPGAAHVQGRRTPGAGAHAHRLRPAHARRAEARRAQAPQPTRSVAAPARAVERPVRDVLAQSPPMRLFALRGAISVERNDAQDILGATDRADAGDHGSQLARARPPSSAASSPPRATSTRSSPRSPRARSASSRCRCCARRRSPCRARMPRVIRVLIHYHAAEGHRPAHVYLGEARELRADLSAAQ